MPRFKFREAESVAHDEHQTFKTIEWATILGPETGPLAFTQPPGPQTLERTDQSSSPAGSASTSISELGSEGLSSAAYSVEDSDIIASNAPTPFNSATPPFIPEILQSKTSTVYLRADSPQQAYRFLPSISGPATLAHLDDKYFAQWRNEVSFLLPPVIRNLTVEIPQFAPLKYAVLAISAAYLSHVESSMVLATRQKRRSRYVPQKDHQYQSLEYYNKGIQGLAESFLIHPCIDPHYMLATSLLFHYFELDSGSFTGGIGHMDGIEKLLSSEYDKLNSTSTGRDLLSATMSLRSVFVNRCIVGGSKISRPVSKVAIFPLKHPVVDAELKAGTLYDSITILMFDCLFTERRIILDWCVCRAKSPNGGAKDVLAWLLSQMQLPESRDASSVEELAEIDNSYRKALEQQRASLDEWHSKLPLSELPMDSFTSQKQAFFEESTTKLEIYPLKFRSFDSAMNYAYYATCQVLSSPNMLDRLYSRTDITIPFTRKNYPWEELILRIAAGLDFADCIHKNTFRSGMMSLLTLCTISCPNPNVSLWVEKWIGHLENFGIPLESGLPFQMVKRVGRVLAQQKHNDRDIFLLSPVDTEDTEKADLYQSDFSMQIVVCGKDRRMGRLYSDTLDIP